MKRTVTCPELDRPANIHALPLRRGGRHEVLYCSLWESDRVIESCRETCMTAFDERKKPPKQP